MMAIASFKILQVEFRNVISKLPCVQCSTERNYCQEKTKKSYSHTILFPKTSFPTRTTNDQREDLQKTAQFPELYQWQKSHLKGDEFVLHDGPPYANGDLHMGHAVNKIIKDICNRNYLLQGRKVHYVPGWDCHGLPIELKALQRSKGISASTSLRPDPVKTRRSAREFALEAVAKQKATFESWGVMADWDKEYYLTMDKEYVKNQLRQFLKMHEANLIFRAMKPVYWSPSSRTALAEAELEYDPHFRSKQVYVTFKLQFVPKKVAFLAQGKQVNAVIWTTTPWTLVLNRAVCYNPTMNYNLVHLEGTDADQVHIVAADLIEDLEKVLQLKVVKVAEFKGCLLHGATYRNPLLPDELPMLESGHVTSSKGTGLVHIAPAHGPDDFIVALRNNMPVECNVDEAGCFTGIGGWLDRLHVLDGQDTVIGTLGDNILFQGPFVHSYPLDWRTKKPVIFRASQQWFVDTASLKERALKALEAVEILPAASAEQYRQGLRSQLERRPYWCISRQRSWGTPIPVVYAGEDAIINREIVERMCSLIDERGTDFWWKCQVEDVVPKTMLDMYAMQDVKLTMGKDILDIWLDSGLSWSQVLDGRQADVYVEGVDQFTGWFQSSLLTSVALNDRAPYKSILVHGFVVDENKRKMSKSLGNVIHPQVITHGVRKLKQPAYGINTLRWWVASHATQHSQIVISKQLLDDSQKDVIRLRNIMKFLLGVTADMKRGAQPEYKLNLLDKYLLKESHLFKEQVTQNYNAFKFNHVSQMVQNFVSNKVSGLYCHCIKDRLYCSERNALERRGSQMVLHTILVTLCQALGPIMPHLVEEVWSFHSLYDKPFFQTESFGVLEPDEYLNDDVSIVDTFLEMKRELRLLTNNDDLKQYSLTVLARWDFLQSVGPLFLMNSSDVREILEVSSALLQEKRDVGERGWALKVEKTDNRQCLRCRKYNITDEGENCWRCMKVLSTFGDI